MIEIYLESSESDLYDTFQFFYKTEDKNFILFGIIGTVTFSKNNNTCDIELNKVTEEVSSIFDKVTLEGPYEVKRTVPEGTYTMYRITL